MARQDIDRQTRLEPKRIETAVKLIEQLGYKIIYRDNTKIQFTHRGGIVTYFPYSGWAAGKTIRDGRGLVNLLGQLDKVEQKNDDTDN